MAENNPPIREIARQTQFLNVISRDEAVRRFQEHLSLNPLGVEAVSLGESRGRVLSGDVVSPIDVPAFDRSNVDGFAVRSADTTGAMEESPRNLRLNEEVLSSGVQPADAVEAGTATAIATGGVVPRGADAVVMVEYTEVVAGTDPAQIEVLRAVAPGDAVTFAGTDVSRGETILPAGTTLTSREIGVLAAIGLDRVEVYRKPTVAVISTGDEIVPPGRPLPVGAVYDSNAHIIATAVEELGGDPVVCGAIPDNEDELERAVEQALECDVVILSGGTSKGAGDLSYRVVSRLANPGIIAHGVALKPGKPICLAATQGKPVVILPGFPTSAVFTFHEFVAPVIRAMAGLGRVQRDSLTARLPYRVNSDRGRTEYLLVSLIEGPDGHVAYPLGKGSGSVTTFSLADGFITIDQHTEIVEPEADVEVTLLDRNLRPADLVVIGSHCTGLDLLLSELRRRGASSKTMRVGSTAGLRAAERGECDIAGVHLLDHETDVYNTPFLSDELELVSGYGRMQCLVYRPGDARFEGRTATEAIRSAVDDPTCAMVNRNPGSGTRILFDQLLSASCGEGAARPNGYGVQTRSHNAVAAAIVQQRADWGIAIEPVARHYGLAVIPIREERYDFLVPKSRRNRPAVRLFCEVLGDPKVQQQLHRHGFLT